MKTVSALCMAAVLPALVNGHGYVTTPFGRAEGCRLAKNSGCSGVQYEPQSVEGPDRYPGTGPADGEIASAAIAKWASMNEQGPARWAKNQMSAGWNDFEWTFTAGHSTKDFRYWVTKPGWNTGAPLTRATFEAEPFCTVELGGAKAATNPKHRCHVPPRSGYHVVLAVWDVEDTPASFYNVIDVQFGDFVPVTSTPAPPSTPSPPVTAAPPTPSPAPTAPCTEAVRVPAWGACKDKVNCCVEGYHCDRQSEWYSQCVPVTWPRRV